MFLYQTTEHVLINVVDYFKRMLFDDEFTLALQFFFILNYYNENLQTQIKEK